ncbi:MAG TPA: hypothetical protein VGI22_27645 [Xanthobacteraceae bacterium]|jgi:hypothetical protein
MAQDLNDFMNSLGDRSSTAPAKPSWHPDTPASDPSDDSFLGHGALGSMVRGAGKELTSEAIGAGQLVSSIDPTGALSRLGGYIPHGQDIKDWAMAPSEGGWETAGSVVGGALPWMLTPEFRAASTLGRVLSKVGSGAVMGAVQPTESGTLLSHVPGAIAGGVTGGAMGRFGGKAAGQKALKGFQKDAYDAVLEPLRANSKYAGLKGPTQIGAAGLKELDDAINRVENNKFAMRGKDVQSAVASARENLNHLHQSRTGEWVDPHGILDYFERNKQLDINHPLRNAAELGRRSGVPPLNRPRSARSWMTGPLAWGLSHAMGVPHAAVHAGLAGLHGLSRQTAGRGAMDELGWLARNADYVRRYGMPLATSGPGQAAGKVGSSLGGDSAPQYEEDTR